ncbi:hypothetical protein GCM10022232_59120 [Streptomyces plumbiresistens]|uniref:Uncharacterized protein n=1 Tax=Streptomyces plumbiresistens TaxID=511811 RepID=A0ABP7SDS2_9ACTN
MCRLPCTVEGGQQWHRTDGCPGRLRAGRGNLRTVALSPVESRHDDLLEGPLLDPLDLFGDVLDRVSGIAEHSHTGLQTDHIALYEQDPVTDRRGGRPPGPHTLEATKDLTPGLIEEGTSSVRNAEGPARPGALVTTPRHKRSHWAFLNMGNVVGEGWLDDSP